MSPEQNATHDETMRIVDAHIAATDATMTRIAEQLVALAARRDRLG